MDEIIVATNTDSVVADTPTEAVDTVAVDTPVVANAPVAVDTPADTPVETDDTVKTAEETTAESAETPAVVNPVEMMDEQVLEYVNNAFDQLEMPETDKLRIIDEFNTNLSLSEESYAAFDNIKPGFGALARILVERSAGFLKQANDALVNQQNQYALSDEDFNHYTQAVSYYADVHNSQVMEIIGGEQGLEKLKTFAHNSLTQAEQEAFYNTTKYPGPNAVQAFKDLVAQYESKVGTLHDTTTKESVAKQQDPGQVAQQAPTVDMFNDPLEYLKASQDSRFASDPKYAQQVMQKYMASVSAGVFPKFNPNHEYWQSVAKRR